MDLLRKILTRFNGLHYPQEYLCLSLESLQQPLHCYLLQPGRQAIDITELQHFVGYSPLVIALPAAIAGNPEIRLILGTQHPSLNEGFETKDALASLVLQETEEQPFLSQGIRLYRGKSGKHRFLNRFSRYMIGLHNRLYQQKPGNVFLPGNLYEQIQIAYSIPRRISLITVGSQGLYNCFPTDLHGPMGDLHYLISLRHQGKACEQVTGAGRILLSEVQSSAYQLVYSLGKNHMQPLKPRQQFPFGTGQSEQFNLPIPAPTLVYRELELLDHYLEGIHKLMLFKVANRQELDAAPATLAHIHNVYATWRNRNRMPGNYLLR